MYLRYESEVEGLITDFACVSTSEELSSDSLAKTMIRDDERTEWPSDEELLKEIEAVSQDPKTVQHGLLKAILEKHGPCQYLQRLGLDGRTDVESFKATVPLSTYPDYQAYIQRLMDGDKDPLLCCSETVAFFKSSGTSAGTSKYFPWGAGIGRSLLHMHPEAVRRSCFPSKLPLREGKMCLLYTGGKMEDTRSGLKASTLSAAFVHTEEFRYFYETVAQVTSPLEVLQCPEVNQAVYGHLLCLLICADVVESINALFAYSIVECFRSLERLWSSLCHDIRTGDVNKDIVTNEVVRQAILSKVLHSPMPEIANKIEEECMKGEWSGIILRLFPNLQYFVCISTGPMVPFSVVLERYTRKGFPRLSLGYGCSEGGHNSFPLRVSIPDPEAFSLWPTLMFYEFLPVRGLEERVAELSGVGGAVHYEEEGRPVELTEVKVGFKYELLLTTEAGLYRYRVEDIFEVIGFYKALPIFKFVCRKGVMLSVNTDKTDEAELQIVVRKASNFLEQRRDMLLAEYSSCTDHSTNPGHYVIYWELEGGSNITAGSKESSNDIRVLQECCNLMDASLNEPYRRGRKNSFIGPLELRVLTPGTFANLRNYAVDRGASLTQYKTPRCVVNETLREILDAGMLHSLNSSFTAWDSRECVGSAGRGNI